MPVIVKNRGCDLSPAAIPTVILMKGDLKASSTHSPCKRQGVRFLAGTDLGGKYVYPGFSLHDELGLLQNAGLTSMEALPAATRDAADSLGVLHRTGTIEVRKAADLVLLDADPLMDIRNTTQIVGVMRNGRFHDRNELDALLAKVAADAPAR